MTMVGIAEIADDIVTLETCAAADAKFADGVAHDRARNPFIGWRTAAASLRMYRLRNVVLDRTMMVLLKDGAIIAETNYLQDPAAIAAACVRPGQLVVADTGVVAALCCDHWDRNYYHWIAHTLPTVHAVLQRHAKRDAALLVPRLAPWQRLSLDLIGAGDLPTVSTQPGTQYFLPVVEYYDFVAGRADYAVSGVSRAAYDSMSPPDASTVADRRLVYIDRGGSANRRLPNEAALAERLRQRGFLAVRPETLDMNQQITLFRQARMVVGQLGAGLANIAFCRPGTVVYELVPEHHVNQCFLAMAMQGGLSYWGDMFPTGVEGGDHTSAWLADIDVDHVMRRIDELAAALP